MKLNKFYFAALAAMTIVSCSNEQDIVSPNSVPDLKPGEALVTFNLTGRWSTRASAAEESAIKLLRYNVYAGEGDTIAINRRYAGVDNNKISFTIPAEKVRELKDQEMKILVLANAEDGDLIRPFGEKLGNATEQATNYTSDKLLEVKKDLSKELEKAETGLPGSVEATFLMAEGMIDIDPSSNKLQRAVSRIYVKLVKKDQSVGDIVGTMQFKNIASSNWIFQPEMKGSTLIPEGNMIQLKNTTEEQVVAYLYPTWAASNPSVEITINGKSQNLKITKDLERNKKYGITINISASTTPEGDGDIDWEASFDNWEDGTLGDADITLPAESIVKEGFTLPEGSDFSYQGGSLMAKVSATLSIPTSDIFPENITNIQVVRVDGGSETRATAFDKLSPDGAVVAAVSNNAFTLTATNTEVAKTKKYSVVFSGEVAGKTKQYILPIVVEGYPENFSAIANGIEVMTVGLQDPTSEDPSSIINIVEEINKLTGTDFAEKSKKYATENAGANEKTIMGERISPYQLINKEIKCPAGFSVPTVAQIEQLFGWSLGRNHAQNGMSYDVVTKLSNSENTVIAVTSPIKHWFFTPVTGDRLFIPGGTTNATQNYTIYSYACDLGSSSNIGRFVFNSGANPIPQLRNNIGVGKTANTFIRCVREAANQ